MEKNRLLDDNSLYYKKVLEHLAGKTVTHHDLDKYAEELGMSGYRLWDILDDLVNDMYISGDNEKGIYRIPLNAHLEVQDANNGKTYLRLEKRKNDYDEYVVKSYVDGKYNEEQTYYTNDWEDAVNTFYASAKQLGFDIVKDEDRVKVAAKKEVVKDEALKIDQELVDKLSDDVYDEIIKIVEKNSFEVNKDDILFSYTGNSSEPDPIFDETSFVDEDNYKGIFLTYCLDMSGQNEEKGKEYVAKGYFTIEYQIENETYDEVLDEIKTSLNYYLSNPFITDIEEIDGSFNDSKSVKDNYIRKTLVLKDPSSDVNKYLSNVSSSRVGKSITIEGDEDKIKDVYKDLVGSGLFETPSSLDNVPTEANYEEEVKHNKSELDDAKSYGMLCWELEQFMRDICQNEELYYGTQWLAECYPDGASKQEVIDEFDTKEDYDNWRENAKSIYEYGRKRDIDDPDGDYALGGFLVEKYCSPRSIEIAHQFDKELGFDPIEVK